MQSEEKEKSPMSYVCRYRHLTNEQLLERQKSLSARLDKVFESKDRNRGLQISNIRRQLWKVMDEQDKRRSELKTE